MALKSKGDDDKIPPTKSKMAKQKGVRRNSNRSPTPDDAALRNPDAKIVQRPGVGDWLCPHCDHVCANYSNMQASSQILLSKPLYLGIGTSTSVPMIINNENVSHFNFTS